MKFSMLAIAAAALTSGVNGFAVNNHFGVRSVSKIGMPDMWDIISEVWGERKRNNHHK